MKPLSILFIILFGAYTIFGQDRVSIGHTNPVAKLDLRGVAADPSIPGSLSTGVLRIGVSDIEGIDIGKMGGSPYSGWIQAGYNGTTTDPLSIQPMGGIVGVGTANPHLSAQLEVQSTTGGFLPPRMTAAQRDAIPNPSEGLVIWCTNCSEINVFNGTTWLTLAGRAPTINPPHVIICDQDWMARNLDVSTYSNGDPIPHVTDPVIWDGLTTGAYCYYANDSATYAATYGKLYNWYAVNDPRGLAPTGWHVPTYGEYQILEACLGGSAVAGGPIKEAGLVHWDAPNTDATNASGFTCLPGGQRFSNEDFYDEGTIGFLWTSSEYIPAPSNAHVMVLEYDDANIGVAINSKQLGYSVRCVRD